MTIDQLKNLGAELFSLIQDAHNAYVKDGGEMGFAEFLTWIEYRSDTGFTFFANHEYNPHDIDDEESIESVSGEFISWLRHLLGVVVYNAKLSADEIAINIPEVHVYWQQGRTTKEVFFDIWQQDAGNYYKC